MLLAPGIESCDLGFLDLMSPVNVNSSLNQGLVSRWQVVPGLEGTKFWYDLCGQNKGTLTNGPTWDGARGRPGGAGSLRFDGSDDYINIPTTFSQSQLTLSLWAYHASVSGNRYLASCAPSAWTSGFAVLSVSGALWVIACGSGTTADVLTTSYTITTGSWRMYTLTYDGATERAYVDASSVGSKSVASYVPAAQALTLGVGDRGGPGPYNGHIDDVRIWSRALSASEVKSVYEDSRAGSPQTLNWISPYYVPRQLTAQEPVPGDVYGLFGGGDFTGIQMGVPPEAIAAVGGYQGLLDFIGIPYGLPSQITPSAGNQAAARRRFYRHVVMHQTYRSILDHSRMTEVAHLALVNRIANQWNEYQAQLARSREIAIFATLLSEV